MKTSSDVHLEKIANHLNNFLKKSKEENPKGKYTTSNGLYGSIYAPTYKSLLFEEFIKYNKNESKIKGSDYFREMLYSKLKDGTKRARSDILTKFSDMWDEWKFAIDEGRKKGFIK